MARSLVLATLVGLVLAREDTESASFRPIGPFTAQAPVLRKDCHDKLRDGDFCDVRSGDCDNRCMRGTWQHVVTKARQFDRGQCCSKQDQPFACRDKDAHRMCCSGYEEIEQVNYYNTTSGKMMRHGKKNGICSCFLVAEVTPEVVREGYMDTPRDLFEVRALPMLPPKPKKQPCANCTRWEISHVRQVMLKLKMKTNETKPSEWIIHTPSGRVTAKDGLRELPPVITKPMRNVTMSNLTDGSNLTNTSSI